MDQASVGQIGLAALCVHLAVCVYDDCRQIQVRMGHPCCALGHDLCANVLRIIYSSAKPHITYLDKT